MSYEIQMIDKLSLGSFHDRSTTLKLPDPVTSVPVIIIKLQPVSIRSIKSIFHSVFVPYVPFIKFDRDLREHYTEPSFLYLPIASE